MSSPRTAAAISLRIASYLLVVACMPGDIPGLDPARKLSVTVFVRQHCTRLKTYIGNNIINYILTILPAA